jgi:ParB-like chromosome segregation protein Spo0J
MILRDQVVPLALVDQADRSFQITTQTRIDDLNASIPEIGLLTPPVLKAGAQGYTIISGFRRIAACSALRWPTIPSRCVPPEAPPYACALIAISANALERPLNLIEQSRALNLLHAHAPTDTDLAKTAAMLGLPDNASIVHKIRSLGTLGATTQNAILAGTLSLAMALELGRLDSVSAEVLVKLFSDLKLSLNKQREIIGYLIDICARDETSIHVLLDQEAIQKIWTSQDLDRTQKARQIRNWLHRKRFPELSAVERQFKEQLNNLKLGQGIDLTPPRGFEGPTYRLTAAISQPEDLDRLQTIIMQIRRNKILEAILAKKFKPTEPRRYSKFRGSLPYYKD